MKFSVSKEKFLAGLQAVQNVVSTRTTLPILSNVLLQAQGGTLRLTTSDLDATVTRTLDSQNAEIESEGATTIPVRKLVTVVHSLPANDIFVESDAKNVVSIRCGQSFFKMYGLPEDEFPPIATFEEAKVFTLKQRDLKDALKKTAYAISTDETRYVLNGILFSFSEGKLTMVATDGRRLALVDLEVDFPATQDVDVIVPSKCVTELTRMIGEEGTITMSVAPNHVAFETPSTFLISKLIEGNYPNYRQVIPGEAKERVTLEREQFLNAVHRVSLLASEKSNSVKLVFTQNNIEIAANTPDVGEAHESMPVSYKGPDMAIAFNPDFLMAPLRNLPNDEVYLDLIDEMSPGVIKIQSPFLYVLMPMRIS